MRKLMIITITRRKKKTVGIEFIEQKVDPEMNKMLLTLDG